MTTQPVVRTDDRTRTDRADRQPETTSLSAATDNAAPGRRAGAATATATKAWRQPVPGPNLPGVVTGVTLVLGLWLLLAPVLLDYGNAAGGFGPRWNDWLLGLLLIAVATARFTRFARLAPVTLVSVTLGLWLFVAPFVLAYGFAEKSALVTLNDMAVGTTVVVLAALGHMAGRMNATGSRL